MTDYELSEIDYLVLEYINNFDTVSKEQLFQHFSYKIDELDYRLSLLKTPVFRLVGNSRIPIDDSNYIEEICVQTNNNGVVTCKGTNEFYITPLGKKVLRDYKSHKKSQRIELWIKNAWLPIIVSIITTLLTTCITRMLQLILK